MVLLFGNQAGRGKVPKEELWNTAMLVMRRSLPSDTDIPQREDSRSGSRIVLR
jgi:hypothetical protein